MIKENTRAQSINNCFKYHQVKSVKIIKIEIFSNKFYCNRNIDLCMLAPLYLHNHINMKEYLKTLLEHRPFLHSNYSYLLAAISEGCVFKLYFQAK